MNNINYDTNGSISSKLNGYPYYIAFVLYLIATLYTNQILAYYNSNDTIEFLQFPISKNYDYIDANDSIISTTSSMDEEYEELGLARISSKKIRRADSIQLPEFPIPKVSSTPGLGLGTHSDDGSLIGDVPIVINKSLMKKRDKTNSDGINNSNNNNNIDSSDERMTLLQHINKDNNNNNNNILRNKSLKYSGDENDSNPVGRWIYLKKDLRQNQRDNDNKK